MQDWREIHKGFGEKPYRGDKINQQEWEKLGFTYQEAKAWIKISLEPKDYKLASYFRGKDYDHSIVQANLEQLKAEYENWQQTPKDAQEYLDLIYPLTIRKEIKELDISAKNLTNSLLIDNWPQLKLIDCSENELTNLKLNNLPVLTIINCHNNPLIGFDFLTNCWKSLTYLNFNGNSLIGDLTPFSKFINCETIYLYNNPLTGSLAPLQNLSKLKGLSIDNTQINSGLEYLPESLEYFDCGENNLAKELELYGEPDDDNYLNLLNSWRKDNRFFIAKVQLLADRDRQIVSLMAELEIKEEELATSLVDQKQLKQEKIELEIKLETLQTKYEELLEQADNRQKILKEIGGKREELGKLRKTCELNDYQKLLIKYLLEAQEDFIKYNTVADEKKVGEITKLFKSKGFSNIDDLCLLQVEITRLDKQLDQTRNQAEIIIQDLMKLTKGQFMIKGKRQNLILFGDINYSKVDRVNIENSQITGSLIIGTGQANLTNPTKTTIEEITEEFQANIQLPPKSNQSN